MESDRQDGWRDADGPRRWSARWWFLRLAFSFIVLGAVAALESSRARQRGDDAQATVLLIGAVAAIGLGFVGVRMRHRRH